MKIYLRNQNSFNPEVVEFYKKHFEITNEKEANILVINDFNPIEAPDKIVACNSTGIEHIKAKEIISLRGEDLSDLTAVAELSICMAGYLMRIFRKEELKDKSLGIVGFGRIGKQFSKMAFAMGMNVWVYDNRMKKKYKKMDYTIFKLKSGEYVYGTTWLKYVLNCDIVSLHITADEENRNFMDRQKFEQMKDGAIFLNSARPWLVEESALKWALDDKLAGAWFDFEMPFKHPKLITTPHIAGGTKESRAKTEMVIAKKLLKLYGKKS